MASQAAGAGEKSEPRLDPIIAPSLNWIEKQITNLSEIEAVWTNNMNVSRAMVSVIGERILKFRELEAAYLEDHPEEAKEAAKRRYRDDH